MMASKTANSFAFSCFFCTQWKINTHKKWTANIQNNNGQSISKTAVDPCRIVCKVAVTMWNRTSRLWTKTHKIVQLACSFLQSLFVTSNENEIKPNAKWHQVDPLLQMCYFICFKCISSQIQFSWSEQINTQDMWALSQLQMSKQLNLHRKPAHLVISHAAVQEQWHINHLTFWMHSFWISYNGTTKMRVVNFHHCDALVHRRVQTWFVEKNLFCEFLCAICS